MIISFQAGKYCAQVKRCLYGRCHTYLDCDAHQCGSLRDEESLLWRRAMSIAEGGDAGGKFGGVCAEIRGVMPG